jgi:hypothetical protein
LVHPSLTGLLLTASLGSAPALTLVPQRLIRRPLFSFPPGPNGPTPRPNVESARIYRRRRPDSKTPVANVTRAAQHFAEGYGVEAGAWRAPSPWSEGEVVAPLRIWGCPR